MSGEEIAIGVAFFSGELLQGKIGIGFAAVRKLETGGTAAVDDLSIRPGLSQNKEIGQSSVMKCHPDLRYQG